MFFELVAPVGQHRRLGTVGHAIQLGARARQIALGPAYQTDVLHIARHQIAKSVVRVGQLPVREKAFQWCDEFLFDVAHPSR